MPDGTERTIDRLAIADRLKRDLAKKVVQFEDIKLARALRAEMDELDRLTIRQDDGMTTTTNAAEEIWDRMPPIPHCRCTDIPIPEEDD